MLLIIRQIDRYICLMSLQQIQIMFLVFSYTLIPLIHCSPNTNAIDA